MRDRLLTDEHAPAEYRVNGIVRNFDPWYAAFGVKEGDKLFGRGRGLRAHLRHGVTTRADSAECAIHAAS